jgi:hypothetical protein
MNHRIGRAVFSLAVGLIVAMLSYQWVTNPSLRAERAAEENVVRVSRSLLVPLIDSGDLQIVDPLAPDRNVGKAYVYREGPGWAVSGYYRRDGTDHWHPYLVTLTKDLQLVRLKVQDSALAGQADKNPAIEVRP